MKKLICLFILSFSIISILAQNIFSQNKIIYKKDTVLYKYKKVIPVKFTFVTEWTTLLGKGLKPQYISSTFGVLVNDRHSITLGPHFLIAYSGYTITGWPVMPKFNYRFILLKKSKVNLFLNFTIAVPTPYRSTESEWRYEDYKWIYYNPISYYGGGIAGLGIRLKLNKYFILFSDIGITYYEKVFHYDYNYYRQGELYWPERRTIGLLALNIGFEYIK